MGCSRLGVQELVLVFVVEVFALAVSFLVVQVLVAVSLVYSALFPCFLLYQFFFCCVSVSGGKSLKSVAMSVMRSSPASSPCRWMCRI